MWKTSLILINWCAEFQILPSFSQSLTIKEALETDAQLNEEVKKTEFNGEFCKIFQILRDIFFRQRKQPIKRRIGVTKRPRLLNQRKVIAIAISPIIVHLTT